ncbi:DNA -binding domain-containing protein [Parasphingorhabdus sp.]|uniref:DNA -binding domain-containing protein n=1 Tax=Parasphingorhabdus sp. TaxID=2709688 RepID=UPI003D2C3F0E
MDASYALRSVASDRLYRFMAGLKSQRRPPGIIPTAYQRVRLIQLLSLLDAEHDGCSRREAAFQILFPRHRLPSNSEWKASNKRRGMYRTLNSARGVCVNGYRLLLQGFVT